MSEIRREEGSKRDCEKKGEESMERLREGVKKGKRESEGKGKESEEVRESKRVRKREIK